MAKKAMLGISRSPCLLSTGCTQQLGCTSNAYAVSQRFSRHGIGFQVTRHARLGQEKLPCKHADIATASPQSIKARDAIEKRAAYVAAVIDIAAEAAHARAVQHILDVALPAHHKRCL